MGDERLFYPATERNRNAIYQILENYIQPQAKILEVASGSGEHITHFARFFKETSFQPTDIEEECLASIQSWTSHLGLENVHQPFVLDTTEDFKTGEHYDGLLCINMIHISPWQSTIGLMEKASRLLNDQGFIYLYGPFKIDGQHTSESNVEFEKWLKSKDSSFGVRDLDDVCQLAAKNKLAFESKIAMPANNFSVVFRKQ